MTLGTTALSRIIALIGYLYAVVVSADWHTFDVIEVGPEGLRRGRIPWTRITRVHREIKDLQNSLGMTFASQVLTVYEATIQLTYFDARWYRPQSLDQLVAAMAEFVTIEETRQLVPPT